MKRLLWVLILIPSLAALLILFSLPMAAEEETPEKAEIVKTTEDAKIAVAADTTTPTHGKSEFVGFSLGTPGGISFHFVYLGSNFGIMGSASVFDVIVPFEGMFDFMGAMDSEEEEEYKGIKYIYLFSAQINFMLPAYQKNNFDIFLSVISGGFHYSSDYDKYKIGMIYVGIAMNLFYKNFSSFRNVGNFFNQKQI